MARRKGRPVHGWLVLDKPAGLGSTAALGIVKRIFGAAKAGHAGTLDPLASGVLPIALGEATKTVAFAMDGSKTYTFAIRWGEARTTEDGEGAVTATSAVRPDAARIRAILPRFTGPIRQRPPAFSAIKVDGNRAYDLARAGAAVALEERVVAIDALDYLGSPDPDHAEFRCRCGKGTYIRALGRDIALALGTVGYISALRRERVGRFAVAEAISLASLREIGQKAAAGGAADGGPAPLLLAQLKPIETALDGIPALALTGGEADRLRQGRPVPVLRGDNRAVADTLPPGSTLYAMADGKIVALLRWDGALVHPLRLFNL